MSATPLPSLMPTPRDTASSHSVTHPLSHPAYRPDIDGLRAVAVLAVVLYHAFPGSARGGFVGVDIFFIISGFLISTILFGNLAKDRFSFIEFYVRRVRRIFPALLVVMGATFVFGWFALMGDEFQQLGKHLAAGAGFVSNIVLWRESGYFDTAAETKPFLHLWSLGIEEQFYIVWPVILWMVWRLRSSALAVTLVAIAASFAFNIHLSTTDRVADFYSPVSRFWELSLGSLLAYLTVFDKGWANHLRPRQRDLQSGIGAALIAVSLIVTDSKSVFPGWWALLPTIGAALLIAAGSGAWVNRRVLSNRVMVWIGLISFPLYLWHWPILSLIRVVAAERPTRAVRIVAVLAAIALAWITYQLVEKPIRRRSRNRRIPIGLAIAMTLVGAIGVACFRDDGFSFRAAANRAVVHSGDIGHETYYAYSAAHFMPCSPVEIRREAEQWEGMVRCLQSHEGPVDVAIVGDSHAEHLFVGLAEALPALNVAYYVRSAFPIVDNPTFDRIFATVVADPDIKTVVLSAWWSLRFTETPSEETPLDALRKTLKRLTDAGKTVYLTDDTPNFSFSPRLCKYDSSLLRLNKCSDDADFYGRQLVKYREAFDGLAQENPGVRILDTSRYFCSGTSCSVLDEGRLMFRDSDHLNIAGSQLLGRKLVEDHPGLARTEAHSR